MGKGEEDQGARALFAMSCVLLGGAVALLCCFVLLLICAAAVSQGLIGEGVMSRVTVFACVVGAFVGGRTAARQLGSRAFIAGVCTGGVLFLFLLTIGVLFYDGVTLADNGMMQALACLLGGALAGLLGRRSRLSQARKKRRK